MGSIQQMEHYDSLCTPADEPLHVYGRSLTIGEHESPFAALEIVYFVSNVRCKASCST